MKILQLCLRVPFPPSDGGTIAMYNMSMALHKAGCQVKILTFNTRKHFVDPATLPQSFIDTFKPELVYLDATVRFLPALLNLFTGSSYNIARFRNKLFEMELESLLSKDSYDVILLESLFVTPYIDTIRKKSKARIILRAHNVEFLIWNRLASSERNILKKWYLTLLTSRLKKYESETMNKLDGIITLTEEDKNLVISMNPCANVLVAPVGIGVDEYQVTKPSPSPGVFHLGSMDWLPNIEGVSWFLQHVWPILSQTDFNGTVYLAGKEMPVEFYKLKQDNLQISGRVDDAGAFAAGKQIMMVPLLSGGGMRVKIIEGMAMGKTIISTSVGAEGIKYTPGENIIIADDAHAFAQAIVQCCNDSDFCNKIGASAHKLALEVYNNNVIGQQVTDFLRQI